MWIRYLYGVQLKVETWKSIISTGFATALTITSKQECQSISRNICSLAFEHKSQLIWAESSRVREQAVSSKREILLNTIISREIFIFTLDSWSNLNKRKFTLNKKIQPCDEIYPFAIIRQWIALCYELHKVDNRCRWATPLTSCRRENSRAYCNTFPRTDNGRIFWWGFYGWGVDKATAGVTSVTGRTRRACKGSGVTRLILTPATAARNVERWSSREQTVYWFFTLLRREVDDISSGRANNWDFLGEITLYQRRKGSSRVPYPSQIRQGIYVDWCVDNTG
jgi:hypothetical protein